jgi:hypothetical protein
LREVVPRSKRLGYAAVHRQDPLADTRTEGQLEEEVAQLVPQAHRELVPALLEKAVSEETPLVGSLMATLTKAKAHWSSPDVDLRRFVVPAQQIDVLGVEQLHGEQ